MYVNKSIHYGNDILSVKYDEPNECPLCHRAIQPVELNTTPYKSNDNQTMLAVTYLCKACSRPFITYHSLYKDTKTGGLYGKLIIIGPSQFQRMIFEPKIIRLSPSFDEIYNQAYAAETTGLDQIAGMGYRKALEFLVKDYCIRFHPDEAESIIVMQLSPIIKKYIDDPRIKTLAERTAWLGNDETHYVRKHTDRDINDLKDLIKATVYYIGIALIAEDADTITPV